MKRFLLFLMALAMMMALAACGGSDDTATPDDDTSQTETNENNTENNTEPNTEPVAGVDLDALKAQMISAAGIADYIDVSADNLTNVYGIDAAQVVNAAIFNATREAAFPAEVVMVQAVDEAAAADVAAKLEARLGAIAEQAASYDAESLALAESCDVVVSGVYVGMFFTEHYDAMVADFQAAVG